MRALILSRGRRSVGAMRLIYADMCRKDSNESVRKGKNSKQDKEIAERVDGSEKKTLVKPAK